MTRAKSKRPKPPEHLEGEALLEWERICDELAAIKRLDVVDRALLTVYTETWAVWREASKHVGTFGPVVKLNNGVVCVSPYYRTQSETSRQLATLLEKMGLTPASRGGSGDDDGGDLPL